MLRECVSVATILIILPLKLQGLTQAEIDERNWKAFLESCNKYYGDPSVNAYRKMIYLENLSRVNTCNEQFQGNQIKFSCKITCRSDWTKAEQKALLQGYINSFSKTQVSPTMNNSLPPNKVDWTIRGGIKSPYDQDLCSCSWAVATIRTLESHCFIKTGKNISFSIQELIECSQEFDNAGCDGGRMDAAYNYIKKYGISTAKDYPTTPQAGLCRRTTTPRSSLVLDGYVYNPEGDEQSLMKCAAMGPMTVAIDSNSWSFQHYAKGILHPDCSSYDLNLALLLIGYGEENGTPFWLCQSPLGKGWGDNGWVKLIRNKNNNCGIATDASLPLVVSC